MLQTSLDDAYQLFLAADYSAALQRLEGVLEVDPDCGRAWELRGLLAWVSGERDLTEHALETAASLVPLQPAPAVALGDSYAAVGRHELAIAWYEQSAEHPERNVGSLLAAATGLDALDLPYRSVRICRLAIQRDPEFAQSYFDLSYYLGRTGAPTHIVEAAARKAIELAPHRLNYRIGLASFLSQRRRTSEAYQLVRNLTPAELSQWNCSQCLEHLQAIFAACNDEASLAACQTRSKELRQLSIAGDVRGDDTCNG